MPLNVHHAGDPDGPPVLAVHGATGHGLRYRRLFDACPQLRWISIDVRGHGRSTWAPPWNLERHADDALGVLDELGIERAAVVAHSFGGAIATHLARRAPDRISRLALLDPAIGLDPAAMLERAEEYRADESWSSRDAARADRIATWPEVPGEFVDDELAEHLEERDGVLRWRYSRASLVAAWSEMARPAVVPPAGLPTLVVPATGADFVREEWLAACRAELGDDLTVRPFDCGHMVYLERPDETAAELLAFLDTPETVMNREAHRARSS
ncbi:MULTISPECIES: alpha/beta fold hydrolase [Pseudonocardia]|uniref:Tropinesterase n=2 Tax=Pseudonocardia TaxID=1847 RepID=A0A1Y2N5K3_PSEAH|nr:MULTISPECIES: alpha/beta hydrolase [Pseudonocardia]OSY42745.1 Tropinesterase [Pseudonocardia autotrophica]TDN77322.1 lipase [Pseudonocardia autotrophica]BBG01344.1 putative hydrolase, alpha/beta fold LipV [Pseudonocardia autotrophica]GEC24400.1 putative hydrolase, alpha/beta fold LipV [Pseudonocardia saturnea]